MILTSSTVLFFQNMWLLIFLHFITWYPLGDNNKKHGMMHHQCSPVFSFLIWFFFSHIVYCFPGRALEFLAFLDTASESEVLGFKELVVRSSSLSREGSLSRHKASTSDSQPLDTQAAQNALLATAAMKFTYVVAAQEYGRQKVDKDDRAWGISWLMRTYKGLRIAYVDKVEVGSESHCFSVLVKYDPIIQEEVEIYRVRLPGPFIGEGKPENQNHAIIFTRGDALQTIDMNQV
jgi:callose synthase